MDDVKLGDRVRRKVSYGGEGGSSLPPEEGTVVYIHPEGRFYSVEFTFRSPYGVRRFRESYPLPPDPDRVLHDTPTQPFSRGGHYRQSQKAALGRYLESIGLRTK